MTCLLYVETHMNLITPRTLTCSLFCRRELISCCVCGSVARCTPPPTRGTDFHHITPPHHLLNFVQMLMVWQCDDVMPL